MNYRRSIQLAAFTIAVLAFAATSLAGVFGGTLKSVSKSSKTIAVQAASSSSIRVFQLRSSTRIRLDGKSALLSRLKPGMKVSVFTSSSGAVTRLTVRTESSSSPAATKPKLEKKEPSTSRTSRKRRARSDSASTGSQWSQFRGPNRDNVSSEKGLLKSWPRSGPKLLWTARDLGQGYSTVSLSNGLVYTMGNARGNEMIFALDLQTGQEIWNARNASASRLNAGNGPRSTPTIDGETLWALGGNGDLSCVDARDGQVRWQKNILREFRGRIPEFRSVATSRQ